jgi:hypothetical protein
LLSINLINQYKELVFNKQKTYIALMSDSREPPLAKAVCGLEGCPLPPPTAPPFSLS